METNQLSVDWWAFYMYQHDKWGEASKVILLMEKEMEFATQKAGKQASFHALYQDKLKAKFDGGSHCHPLLPSIQTTR